MASSSPTIKSPTRRKLKEVAEEIKAGRILRHSASGYGRLQPLPGSFGADLPANSRLPAPAHSRLHRPAQIKHTEEKLDLAKTLFIVSSKSGSTLEPNIYKQYFFERMKQTVGDKAGSHFIAITDPGSKMQQVAERDRFRHIFYGLPSIGGRYSALSNFGMVPAAAMGMDVEKFLERTKQMVDACARGRSGRAKSRRHARHHHGHRREAGTRQDHTDHFARHSRSRRMAGAVDRRIYRQNGQRHYPGGSRRLWARPRFTATDRIFAYIRLESEH